MVSFVVSLLPPFISFPRRLSIFPSHLSLPSFPTLTYVISLKKDFSSFQSSSAIAFSECHPILGSYHQSIASGSIPEQPVTPSIDHEYIRLNDVIGQERVGDKMNDDE